MTTDATPASRNVHVWSVCQRAAHWLLALAVLGCLVLYEGGDWHLVLGYVALAVACWRCVRGWWGPVEERFSSFVERPSSTWAYARAVMARREARHLNHNPLGAWMIVALLLCAVLAGASGALYDTDAFWGDPVVYTVHQISGWAFAVLVPLHLAGVAWSSWRHRENLVVAMLNGRKRTPDAPESTRPPPHP